MGCTGPKTSFWFPPTFKYTCTDLAPLRMPKKDMCIRPWGSLCRKRWVSALTHICFEGVSQGRAGTERDQRVGPFYVKCCYRPTCSPRQDRKQYPQRNRSELCEKMIAAESNVSVISCTVHRQWGVQNRNLKRWHSRDSDHDKQKSRCNCQNENNEQVEVTKLRSFL